MPALRAPSVTAIVIALSAIAAGSMSRCGRDASPPASTSLGSTPANAPPNPGAVANSAQPTSQDAGADARAPIDSGPDVAPAPAGPVNVVVLGDSLTDGRVGGGGYWKYLKKRCPKSQFHDFGKGADMVNQMRKRFFRDVMNDDGRAFGGQHYTHVVVFGGVNDLYSDLTAGRTVKLISDDLSRIYGAAHRHGARVVAITVAPWGGFTKYFNERRGEATLRLNGWISEQASAGKIDAVVDAYALLSCGRTTHLCADYGHPIRDGLHFGAGGHEVLGKALYDAEFSGCR